MATRSGSADLPLHGGRVPRWLAARMERMARVVAEAIVHHYGREGLLRRLAHPFWFQSFGAVMGMDWHSSGITTSVLSALKRGLAPLRGELGLHVCGGRGRQSRRTPGELLEVGERTGLDGEALARTSRLVAKVDSTAVQDGFALYLHGFVVADDGAWVVVQQGMCPERREARRYHWLSESAGNCLDEPHAAIDGRPHGAVLNLTDRRAGPSRSAQLGLVAEGPERALAALREARAAASSPRLHLGLPAHHDVRAGDVVTRRLRGVLAAAAERGPRDFADLLLTPGLGARTVEALAFVAEVVHGAPSRFSDPARFAFALGGKDGHPFPVPLAVYDETLAVLRRAVERARLGQDERLAALRRLGDAARRLERVARGGLPSGGPDLATLVARERRDAPRWGGHTVAGPARAPRPAAAQLALPGLGPAGSGEQR